jgi:hypothetical protein
VKRRSWHGSLLGRGTSLLPSFTVVLAGGVCLAVPLLIPLLGMLQ